MPTKNQPEPRKPILLILILLIVAVGIGLFIGFVHPLRFIPTSITSRFMAPVISEPLLDTQYSESVIVNPNTETTAQVTNSDKVIISISIPKGALTTGQLIKITPLHHDNTSGAFTPGVYISPANIVFNTPISLTFDFSHSQLKSDAPKTPNPKTPRTTGKTQVLFYEKTTGTLSPTLISRSAETATFLPARIITGGAYIYSLDGNYQDYFAKSVLEKKETNVLSLLESATTLLTHNQALSREQVTQVKDSVSKIMAKKAPPASEFFAAAVLQKQLDKKYASLIPKVYAADVVVRTYLEFMCKVQGLSIDQYLTEASTAQLFGLPDVAEGCLTAVKNIVADQARAVLNNQNATLKDVFLMRQKVQLLGLDELDSALLQKAKDVAVRDAQKVIADPNATDVDIIMVMQELQLTDAGRADLESQLLDKIKTAHHGTLPPPPPPQPPPPDTSIGFDMSVIWLMLAKALGIGPDSFDGPGIKAWVDTWVARVEEMHPLVIELCYAVREFGQQMGSDVSQLKCEAWDAELTDLTNKLKRAGACAVAQVGGIQGRGYQPEDFGIQSTRTGDQRVPDNLHQCDQ